MSKKIVISTFNNSDNNYGAVFQSYALGKFLENMAYDVSFITLNNRSKRTNNIIILIKRICKRILQMPIRNKIRRRKEGFHKFTQVSQKQLVYNDKEALYSKPPVADAFISGSDQVWNPVLIHDDLMLGYVPNESKKIAYAASMGNEIIPQHNESEFSHFISRYDHISVREDSMVNIIKRYTNKDVYHHIDPVMLLTVKEWAAVEKEYKDLNFNEFIFIYVIEWTQRFENKLRKMKEETGLPVISINMGNIKRTCADQVIYDASPEEFLYLLKNAKFVITTSFHGTVLSIVYNKQFVALPGTDKPTRINSLLRHYNLLERVSFDNVYKEINYNSINSIILKDRDNAKDYLIKAIEE